ncbi:MAG: acyltransferase, partial [Rhizobiaceae bacterium]|nr:acyltransferase [Rhizobiaceae bacterium]
MRNAVAETSASRRATGILRVPAPDGRHYTAVDLLRGLAALAVLLWHYQHFWFPPAGQPATLPPLVQLPLSGTLWPFYLYGHYAVQLFWVISGFVFAAVYAGRRPSAASFFGARFARLYPLHFVTLLLVAVLQFWSISALGYFQIYLYNDLYHFVLNVFF